ncbi:ent-kaurenoic acid oxidase 1-like isoform X2 [Oryza brachyantha]|uniref:ent-kaurenoic acid oxidase 1-like isoform X2 n=1 Tax=Oryza brachyantha TaxID=4533 RepID=UPI001AD964D3|nr:ent-kaurenoic acid oxidase 1-like isoform X2 [Oryza brachyantha]
MRSYVQQADFMGGMVAADWAWWLGLLAGAVPLLALAVWHCADAFHCAAFAVRHLGGRQRPRLPPGHIGLPFVGETLALLWYFNLARRPDGFVEAKRRRYGGAGDGGDEGVGLYRTHLFGSPTVLACSPAANKFVLQSNDSFAIRWPSPEIVGVSSVVNVHGSQHARLRRFIVAAVNSPRSLRAIAEVVQPRVAAALRSWAAKGTITAATEIKKVTFENICRMFVSMEPSPLTAKIDEWFAGLVAGLRAFPLDIPGTALRRAKKCRRKLHSVFSEELERRKAKLAAGEGGDNDVMSGLMQMEDEQGRRLEDEEVVDNIVSLVLAGYESTSNAIMWAAYYLAKSPHVLAKLREENSAIAKENNGASFITLDDIYKMKYTPKVVEETIRLANIAPMVYRVALRDVEYRGYTIPKGWRVVVWLRSLHVDPKYYDDPFSFNPDRWDKAAKPGTYQVFGVGERICAGNMLARLQLTIMLHHLSCGYRWELLNPDAGVAYLPHPRPMDGAAMSFSEL